MADTEAQRFLFTCFSPGEENWLIVATGVADCYYNVTDLSAGYTFRFRVACVNKAGQSPYSNVSEKVCLDPSGKHLPFSPFLARKIKFIV